MEQSDEMNGNDIISASPQSSRSGPTLPAETEEYLRQVEAELKALEGFHLVRALAEREIARVRAGEITEQGYIIIHRDVPVKIIKKVLIPIKEHPKINFVGRLLGPKGNTLKALQANTNTRIMIFGRGSMWDKTKEEEMRNSGDAKYAHLNEDLHIYIEIHAYPVEAQGRFAHVLNELKKFLDPNHPGYIQTDVDGRAQPPGMRPRMPPPGGMRPPPPPHMRPRHPPPGGPRGYGAPRPPPPTAVAPPAQPVADNSYGYYGSAPQPASQPNYQVSYDYKTPGPRKATLGAFSDAYRSASKPTSEYSDPSSSSLGYAQYPTQQDYSSGTGYETEATPAAGGYGTAATGYGATPAYGQAATAAYTGYESGWGDSSAANGAGGKAQATRFPAAKKPRPSPYGQTAAY